MNDRADYFFAVLDNLMARGIDPVVALAETAKNYSEEVVRAAQVELERIAQGESKK